MTQPASLQRRLEAVALALQACADDSAADGAYDSAHDSAAASAARAAREAQWRSTARAAAATLRGLGEELALLELALAQARSGERRALRRAEQDSLTELPNRDGFDRRLNGVLNLGGRRRGSDAAPRRLAVLYLDLDAFKCVNDSHGHAVGDELLRAIAQRLQRTMRVGDMVCRLGGDEFACLLEGPMNRVDVARMAAELIATVSAPVTLGDLRLSVRPSVGIALCPGDGDSAPELLARADAAMFNAKRRNSGLAFFDGHVDMPATGTAAGTDPASRCGAGSAGRPAEG